MVRHVHSSLRKALTLLLALLMFAALLPAGTATPEDTTRSPAVPEALRQGALLSIEDGEATGPELGDLLDPSRFVSEEGVHLQGLLGALRQAVAQQGGLLTPSPASLGDEAGGAYHYSGIIHYALPGGDFDGDGLAEVLDYAIDLSDWTVSVSAVDGDGTFLWTNNYGGYYDAFPAYIADLDGDGIDEIVVITLDLYGIGAGQCFILTCAWLSSFSGAWNLDVLDGATGAILWTDATPVQVTVTGGYASGLVAFAVAQLVTGTGLGFFPMLSDDTDGDGRTDIIVNSIDATLVLGFGMGIYTIAVVYAETYSTEYRILSGSDGKATLGGTLGPALGIPLALAAGDIDGDGLADLIAVEPQSGSVVLACVLYCAWTEGDLFMRLSGLKGTDGSTVWTRDRPTVATDLYIVGVADLTGDGAADLLLREYSLLSTRTQAHDGTTGDLLYDRSGGSFYPAGDLDGDGGQDLLAVRGYRGSLQLTAASGATGNDLWQQKVESTLDYVYWADVFDAGDVDGDGTADLLVNLFGDDGSDWTTEAFVMSGTGTHLWSSTGAYLLPAGDLDGDGGADFVSVDGTWVSNGVAWTTAAVSGATGTALWSLTETVAGWADLFLAISSDLSGDGGADVLQSIDTWGRQGVLSRARAYSGTDGSVLLEYGDALPTAPPPSSYDQDDAGSGGDAGNDFSTALTIVPGNYTGRLDPDAGDTRDFYAVNLSVGDDVRVVMDPGPIDFDLAVYDADGNHVGSSAGYSVEEVAFTVESNGSHYVRVNAYEWTAGNYTLSINVRLPPEPTPPPVVDPRVENATFAGHIGCGASALMIQTADLCHRIDANSVSNFAFPVDVGVTGLHVEMRWEDGSVLPAERLRIDWLMPGAGGAEGTSPLVLDTEFDTNSTTHRNAGELQLSVRVGKDQGAIADQAFEGCVTILYGGAALPAGSCFDA